MNEINEPREPYTFPCMDDSPLNNGYGYNQREELEPPDEEIDEDDEPE